MKKFLILPLVIGLAATFAACGETNTKVDNVTITLDSSVYVDTVGKIGTKWSIPEAYAKDGLGNSYRCDYVIKSPNGETIIANGGVITLSEIGAYTVTYTLSSDIAECESVTLTYYCTASGDLYTIMVENENALVTEFGAYSVAPTAGVYVGNEKISDCIFRVYDAQNNEMTLINDGFIPTSVGEYTIVYESASAALDVESKTVTISVVDTQAPVITVGELIGNLKYAQTVKLPEWSVYDASEKTVQSVLTDGNGNAVTVDENDMFTVNVAKDYVWKITAEDVHGNKSEYEKTFVVDAYDENVAEGLLSDFDEDFYATESAFITDGKASVYTGVQAISSVVNGALKLQKGTGVSKIGLLFARWTEVTDSTYLYLKIKSNANTIYIGGLEENKLYEMTEVSSLGYSYEEQDWQTLWVKPETLGLTEGNFYGLQLVFDGQSDCAVYLDEIGYDHDFVEYTIETNLGQTDLYEGEEYPVELTISSKNGEISSSDIIVTTLDEDKATVVNGVFYAKQRGKTTLKVQFSDGDKTMTKYLTLDVGGTVAEKIAKTLGEYDVVLWDSDLYTYMLSDLLIEEYNNPFGVDPAAPEGWYLDKSSYAWFVRMNCNAKGSGFRVQFAKPIAATTGCLKINVKFDSASHANTTLKIFGYDETNAENALEYSGFVSGSQDIYVPLSKLANADGVVEGLQFAFTTGGWKMISRMFYDSDYVDYRLTENLSGLTIVEGNEYDLTASIALDGETIENADLRYSVENEECLTIENGKLTAIQRGITTVTIEYYDATGACVFEKNIDVQVYKPIMEQIADSLGENEVFMWNSKLYEYAMSALTVDKYNSDPASWGLYNTDVKSYSCVRINVATNGSGFKLTFPKEREYTTGCLRIRLIFDSDGQGASSTLKIFRYDETDSANGWTFTGFKGGNENFVYIPVALLANTDGTIDGLQFAFTTGGWKMFSDITYLPNHSAYEITENLTSLTMASGEEYDVNVGATDNLVAVNNPDIRYTVADETVLKIANGKLSALKAGTTTVEIALYDTDGTTKLVSKTVTLTVGKSALEQLADSITDNEIHMWDSTLYTHTMGDLIIDGYNNPFKPVDGKPDGWYYWYTTMGKNYDSIRVNADVGGSGMRLTFVKTLTFNENGYLKIRLAARTYHTLHLYNYNETAATNGIVIKGSEVGMNSSNQDTWVTVYVPIKDFLNASGQIEGIQFAVEDHNGSPSGWYGFCKIKYVAAGTDLSDGTLVTK
ncbi:MAG: hypothetical protein IJX75_05505 [Clostridia bacterium]|nr:hypothetical protein [Clostridia bacterium]